ncbi:methyltransferase [Fragilaria crotonensis]|nr:methyltransferase [Fragilaria crotonensis]
MSPCHRLSTRSDHPTSKHVPLNSVQTCVMDKVYVAVGDLGTELRASADVACGDVLFREPVYAFACEDDDDEESLPAMVQVAMNALLLAPPDMDVAERTFHHLIATATEVDDVQKTALFAWGAEQISSRLMGIDLSRTITQIEVIQAIRRVALNAFTVKSLIETEIDLENENLDLAMCITQIGLEEPRGIGVYILASAANHSCAPNAFVTFGENNEITFRAIQSIQAHQAITISYGPVVGVDGNVHRRREEILDSHCFVCECTSCFTETASTTTLVCSADDYEALEFIDSTIIGRNFTAGEALKQSKPSPLAL